MESFLCLFLRYFPLAYCIVSDKLIERPCPLPTFQLYVHLLTPVLCCLSQMILVLWNLPCTSILHHYICSYASERSWCRSIITSCMKHGTICSGINITGHCNWSAGSGAVAPLKGSLQNLRRKRKCYCELELTWSRMNSKIRKIIKKFKKFWNFVARNIDVFST